MEQKIQLWFNDLDPTAKYFGDEPPIINVDNYQEVIDIKRNLEILYDELKQFLLLNEMDPYFNTSLVNNEKDWKTIGLKVWGIPLRKKAKKFPKTNEFLKEHKNILTFSFNRLEPNSVIKPHSGDCNGTIRIHIGLDVPESLPECGFKVKGVEQPWKNGEAFGFIDAFEHESWNRTNSPRYIILLDIIRPELKKWKNYICFRVLMSLLLQKIVYVFPFLLKSPDWFKKSIFVLLGLPKYILSIFSREK